MRSLQSSGECAYGIATYRSQSPTFAVGYSYFPRASYIMQTYRLMPRTALHLL